MQVSYAATRAEKGRSRVGGGRSSPTTAATVSLPPSLLRYPHLRLSASDLEPLLTMVFVFAFSIFNDKRFHPSVRYLKYASERIVSFVPPDGGFKLMSYKINSQAARSVQKTIIPFYVKPQITYSTDSGRISIMVGLKQENAKAPEQVSVKIPLSNSTLSCDMEVSQGTVSVSLPKKEAIWRLGKIKKDKPSCLSARLAFARPEREDSVGGDSKTTESPTFEVSFQLQGMALSGLEVDSMEVTNVRYKPYKGVRYITRSGFFQIRSF